MTPVAAAHVALKDYLRVAGNDYRSGRSAPDTPGKLAWSVALNNYVSQQPFPNP